jgi:hypothetical protein
VERLAKLKNVIGHEQADMLMEAGWATMPGSSDPDRQLASACMDKLAAGF